MLAGSGTGGEFPNGVLELSPAGLISLYSGKPPAGAGGGGGKSNSADVAAKIGPPTGNGVLLNEGKTEPWYSTPPALRVGGPAKRSATPLTRMALPCGMEPIRATICLPSGTACSGWVVGGWIIQMPGSICSAPPVTASLIFCRYVRPNSSIFVL